MRLEKGEDRRHSKGKPNTMEVRRRMKQKRKEETDNDETNG
jgi:hypothetical protein